MDERDTSDRSPVKSGGTGAEPVVLRILRGFFGAVAGLIVGGVAVPIVLALVTTVFLDDPGGPGFRLLIAVPSGLLGAVFGARWLCSVNALQSSGSDEEDGDLRPDQERGD